MIYNGPMIAKEIKKDLIKIIKEQGFKNIGEAVGSYSQTKLKNLYFFSFISYLI